MDLMHKIIDWANYADSRDKIYMVKSLLNLMGNEELRCIKNLLQRRRRRDQEDCRKREWKGPGKPSNIQNLPKLVVRTPEPAVTTPVSEDFFLNHEVDDFISFDVEAVHRYARYLDNEDMPLTEPKSPRHEIIPKLERKLPKAAKLGTVKRVEENKKVFYQQVDDITIKHAPGTYQINFFTKRSNGIRSTWELRNGRGFHEVKEYFKTRYSNKYHITCGGGNDYRYLELVGAKFRNYDLQKFFRRPSETDPDGTPMGLRDIYFHLFKDDIQRGPHNAVTDAKATLRCFFEGYCLLYNQTNDFSKAEKLKKDEERGEFWCRVNQKFELKCNHTKCDLPSSF